MIYQPTMCTSTRATSYP